MTIFVSYARADFKSIQPVLTVLREHGFVLWIDEEGIEGASFWRKEIVEAIEDCSVIIFFATEASCKSDAVFKELALANEDNKPILPVLLNTIKLPSDIRYQVAGIQNINLYPDWDRGVRNIIASLSRITKTEFDKNTELITYSSKITNRTKRRFCYAAKMLTAGGLAITLFASIYFYLNLNLVDIVEKFSGSLKQKTRSVKAQKSLENSGSSQSLVQSQTRALHALVIGNANYKMDGALRNSVNDAKDVSDLLKSMNFVVTELLDMRKDQLLQGIREHYSSLSTTRAITFGKVSAKSDDIVHLVFYSGHSLEINGVQYIIPIDANYALTKNQSQFVSIKDVMPERYGIDIENNYSLYSTESGGLAIDGNRTNSPFTEALLDRLGKPELDLFSAFIQVRQSVKDSTYGLQIPWIEASANQLLWLGDRSKITTNGSTSIVIIDGCRINLFKSELR